MPATQRPTSALEARGRPSANRRERSHIPLKLADAERIASGRHSPVTLAPASLVGRIAHGVRPNLDLDWPAMMSEEMLNAPPATAQPRNVDEDILDLPEPMGERFAPLVSRPSQPPISRGSQFDYAAWSRQLDDLLQRPNAPPPHAHLVELPAGSHAGRTDGAPGIQTRPAIRNDARSIAGAPRQPTWMPIYMLCLSGALMGGIIGGAAYGLASPEALAWVTGAGDLLGRLQIAVSR